jgi:hypothetical protein
MAEKEKEDIVGRLEALRKRIPEEKPTPPPREDERRKKIVRIVGIVIVILIIGSVFLVCYNFLIKPMREKQKVIEKEKEILIVGLDQAKSQKIAEINDAFSGLPSEYATERAQLLDSVNSAQTTSEVQAIDVAGPATQAWRSYMIDEAKKMAERVDKIEMRVEATASYKTYRGLDEIIQAINKMSYSELKGAMIREFAVEYVPIRLKRDKLAGGYPKPGSLIDIYYKSAEGLNKLATDAKVIAFLRSKESGKIAVSESERKMETGGGVSVEGYTTATIGGMGAISETGPASVGYKTIETSTTYAVNIEELQKAAAASKIPESYITSTLEEYGIKLKTIEEEMNIGDFDVEFLVLVEVSEDEAPNIISTQFTQEDRDKIIVTISKTESWMEDI